MRLEKQKNKLLGFDMFVKEMFSYTPNTLKNLYLTKVNY